ncbi:MAG: glycosyltransferase family 4 protein [Candidatus Sulfotelmatobacter sp.]
MKILWAKANKILPVDSGGDIRSYNIARHLAARHELTFFSYYDGAPDGAYGKALQEHFPGAVCVRTGEQHDKPLRRGLDYISRFPRQAPYAVSRFASRAVESQLKRWYAQRAFDVAVCDFLDAAVNFPKDLNIPTVLFQHNVESEIWRRHATNGSSGLRKLVCGLEFSKMQRYEQEMVRRFHHVVAVSEHDKKLMGAWVDTARLSVVPTGVDTEQYCPGKQTGPEKPLVVFVGAMDWEPNVDAVKYFCAEVWPLVQARVPGAHFRIVGRNPGGRVQGLAGASVEVTGRVPSVVEHLREAAVVVVPLRVGGGTRLKIYEAMAVGKAVVSTTVGAEGLDVHHGQDILLSDTPDNFAESVATLLQDVGARARLGHAAAELSANYGWPLIGARFGQILQGVIGQSFATVPRYANTRQNSNNTPRSW